MHACTFACIRTHARLHVCMHMCTRRTRMHACIHARMHTHMHIPTCASTHATHVGLHMNLCCEGWRWPAAGLQCSDNKAKRYFLHLFESHRAISNLQETFQITAKAEEFFELLFVTIWQLFLRRCRIEISRSRAAWRSRLARLRGSDAVVAHHSFKARTTGSVTNGELQW